MFLNILLPLLVYFPILTGFFFMDDFYFLQISQASNIKQFFNFFNPIKFTPFRPISQQLFFFTFQKLFGLNPFPYHAFILIIHILNSVLVYEIFLKLIKNRKKSSLLSLLYVVSPIHFVGLYSITGSYVIFGIFFALLSFWLWLRFESGKNCQYYFASIFCYVLAIFSAEIGASLSLIILLMSKLKNKFKLLAPYFFLVGINLIINIFWAGSPKTDAFSFNLTVFPQTFRWYLLRMMGLPEGVKNGLPWERWILYPGFIILCLILIANLIKEWKTFIILKNKLAKYFLWIVIGAFPFCFMPNHLNPIYFSISFIGFLLFMSQILNLRPLRAYTIIYIFTSLLSIKLLLHTHWTIRRASLAKTWGVKINKNCDRVKEDKLVYPVLNQSEKDELEIALGFNRGPKLICRNSKLEVIFEIPKNE